MLSNLKSSTTPGYLSGISFTNLQTSQAVLGNQKPSATPLSRPSSREMIAKFWQPYDKSINVLYAELNRSKDQLPEGLELYHPTVISRLYELLTYEITSKTEGHYLLDTFCSITAKTDQRTKQFNNAEATLLILTHIASGQLKRHYSNIQTDKEVRGLIKRFFAASTTGNTLRVSKINILLNSLGSALDQHYQCNRSGKLIHLARILNSELFSLQGTSYQVLSDYPEYLQNWLRYRKFLLDKLTNELISITADNGAHRAIAYANAFIYIDSPLYQLLKIETHIATSAKDSWNSAQQQFYTFDKKTELPTLVGYLFLIQQIKNLLYADLENTIKENLTKSLNNLENSLQLQVRELASTLGSYSYSHYLLEINESDTLKIKQELIDFINANNLFTKSQKIYFSQLTNQIINQNPAKPEDNKKQLIPFIGFLQLIESDEDYNKILTALNHIGKNFNRKQSELNRNSNQQVNHNWDMIEYFILSSTAKSLISGEYKQASLAFQNAKEALTNKIDKTPDDITIINKTTFFFQLKEFYVRFIIMPTVKPLTTEIIQVFSQEIAAFKSLPEEIAFRMNHTINQLNKIAPELKPLFKLSSVDLLSIFEDDDLFFNIINQQLSSNYFKRALFAIYQYRNIDMEITKITKMLGSPTLDSFKANELAHYISCLSRAKLMMVSFSHDSNLKQGIISALNEYNLKGELLAVLKKYIQKFNFFYNSTIKKRNFIPGASLLLSTTTHEEKLELQKLIVTMKEYISLIDDNQADFKIVNLPLNQITSDIQKNITLCKSNNKTLAELSEELNDALSKLNPDFDAPKTLIL